MESLSGDTMIFQSLDGGSLQDKEQREKQLANFMAPRELKLKINSQVMLIKNMDESLVNGSIGKVVRFANVEEEGDLALEKNEAKKFGKEPPKKPTGKIYPVVEFLQPGGYKRTVMILPESWKVELPSGEVQVSRTQVSLLEFISTIKKIYRLGSAPVDTILGHVHPQVPGSDVRTSEG
jgi:ATP-dependent DNA helicase PIF1